MAKIIDPDNISFAVNTTATTEEFEIQTGALTLKANISSTNLDDDAPGKTSGVTGKAMYSALKIEWLSNTTLRRYRFPIKMIFEGSFIVTNGWAFADQQTRDVMRDAGFQEALTAANYACMVSLGGMDAPLSDQAYYAQATGFTATTTAYNKTGELNENVEITSSNTYLRSFLREQGKTYAEYNLLNEQGLSLLNFQAYSFPLENETDLKISASDATIDSTTPYTNMKINYLKGSGFTTYANSTVYPAGAVVLDPARNSGGSSNGTWYFTPAGGTSNGADTSSDTGVTDWELYDGQIQIGTEWYAGNRVIDCATGTHVEVYEWWQRQLRKTTDINADDTTSTNQRGFGSVNGEVAELLGGFVGDNLKPAAGVLLTNFDTNSTNNIQHSPITVDGGGLNEYYVPVASSEVAYPFVAAGSLNFSANYVNQPDAQTVYDMYFEYITRTSGSYTITADSGATGDLTWSGTDLDHIQAGDYIVLSGFTTNAENNGEYLVNTVGAGTMNITHQDSSVTVVTETDTVQVDENPFGSLGATLVNDNSGTPITGQISGPSISWDFDYTNNNQGGRTPNSPAPIHIIAMALDGSEWAEATHTISAATGQSIAVNGNDERNYANP